MGRGRNLTQASIVLVAVAFGAAPSFAQTANGGILSLTTGLDVDTNKELDFVSPGTTTTVYERLDYGFRRETGSQLFEFSVGTQLEFDSTEGSGATIGLNETAVDFLYARTSSNGRLQFDGSYHYGDTSRAFDTDPTDASLIGAGDGTLARTETNFLFETGLGDPIGFWFGAGYQTRSYIDSTNISNVNSVTSNIDLGANFRISSRTEATFEFGHEDYQNEASLRKRVEITDLSFGLSHELRSALTLDADFGYRDRETTILGRSISETGYYGGLEFVQLRPNGSIFGGIGFDGTRFLDETSVNIGRTLDLPDGSLSASIEFTNIETIGLEIYGDIDYIKETSTGEFLFRLSRDQDTDDRFRDVIYTSFTVGYRHEINDSSRFRLSLDLARSEDKYFDALIPAENRATFTASYSRAMTPEWDLNVGYRHREYARTGGVGLSNREANSDSVFLTLTRDIEFGF